MMNIVVVCRSLGSRSCLAKVVGHLGVGSEVLRLLVLYLFVMGGCMGS